MEGGGVSPSCERLLPRGCVGVCLPPCPHPNAGASGCLGVCLGGVWRCTCGRERGTPKDAMGRVRSRPRRFHTTAWVMAVLLGVMLGVQRGETARAIAVDMQGTWRRVDETLPKEGPTPEPEPEPPTPPSPPAPKPPPEPKPTPTPKKKEDKGGHLMIILVLLLVLANFAFTAYIGLRTGALEFRSRGGYLSDRFLDQTLA